VTAFGSALVLAAAALAVSRNRDISNPGVRFTPQPDRPPAPPPRPRGSSYPAFVWPAYGYTKQRTRVMPLADPASLHPPYRENWSVHGSTLLEFPPVLGAHSLFILKNNGAVYAVQRQTGHIEWKSKIGNLAAASPAYDNGTVYAVLLQRAPGVDAGRIVALDARNGRIRWSRDLPSRSESSPLVDSGRVFFGSENGTVYCLDAANGNVRWTHHAPGAVKAGIAMDEQRNLYYGTYGGTVQSLHARDGSLRWSASGGENFYATPAVAYGRVYLGNTDGNMYSFGAANGELAWRRSTGSYVYSSPAVGAVAGGAPTVYVGSYDGTLYALDARSGTPRWTHKAEGRISGGIVIIGDLVFYSTLERTTTALGARTGRFFWRTHRGAFNPVVSDGRQLFLVGYSSLFALSPRRAKPPAPAPPAAKPAAPAAGIPWADRGPALAPMPPGLTRGR
jgi:outer membrane protein assembly factor BamB